MAPAAGARESRAPRFSRCLWTRLSGTGRRGPAARAGPGAASLLPPHIQSRGIFSRRPSVCLSLPGHRPLPSLPPSPDPAGFPAGAFLSGFGTGRDTCIAFTPSPRCVQLVPRHAGQVALPACCRASGVRVIPGTHALPVQPGLECSRDTCSSPAHVRPGCREVSRLLQRSEAFIHRPVTGQHSRDTGAFPETCRSG